MASKLPTVAIIGRANMGKKANSLFNRLVKSQQAIVAREAGTTRDNVIGKVTYKNDSKDAQFWLVDTAGLKPPKTNSKPVFKIRSRKLPMLQMSYWFVVDSTQHVGDEERTIAKSAKSGKPVILLTNKADLKGSLPDEEFRRRY